MEPVIVEFQGNIEIFDRDVDEDDILTYLSSKYAIFMHDMYVLHKLDSDDGIMSIQVNLKLHGGVDFQHREGSKTGSGGLLSESQAAIDRKERLRKLALETIDISKDPYFMKNHLGTFECKLCLTLHPSEGNYLAHTQGKRHQSNLGRRAAMEAKSAPSKQTVLVVPKRQVITIGRPGYKVSL
jgi:splicing factor 3A subunit 2